MIADPDESALLPGLTSRTTALEEMLASSDEDSDVRDSWVTRLKEESDVPLRSHGSLSLNWSLMPDSSTSCR